MQNTNSKPKSKVKGVIWKRGAWWLDYRFNGRRHRERVGESQMLAENAMHKIRTEIAENKFLDIKKEKKIKFEVFADEYFERHCKVNQKSYNNSPRSSLKTLKRFFSGKYLHEIDPQAIEKFKVERAKEVSPATVNRALACLKTLFNKAIEWERYDGKNPVKKVKLFKENNKRIRFLEKEEITKLIDNSPEHFRPIIIVALNTGMRKAEILNLKWHDIDFKRGTIYLFETKNNEKREVPMNETVKIALIKVKKHPESPYVFPSKDGKPYTNIRKSFFTALKNAGIINFRFHDLRHNFCSHLAMSGVDLNTIRELVGHKSLEMTLRYSHLSLEHKRRAVDVLEKQMVSFWTPSPKEATIEKPVQDTSNLDTKTYDNICPVV